MPLTPGTRLGAYEVLSPLGAGGMGDVYLARDTRLERRVALKLLSARLSHDAQAIQAFRREAFTLASLNHPNIAIIHGIEDLEDGAAVLVMELVEGETLAARLARAPIAVEEALQVCAQVAEALEVAHEHGVVHRDVKPGNVMIGARGLVKVLDFGLARRGADAPTIAPGALIEGAEADSTAGTPGYMSPEQVRAERVDARTDVFALGSVLYECLAGRPAFGGGKVADVLRATLTSPVDLAALPGAVPARVRALVARCLEKDAGARPGGARAVRIELEEALGIRRAAALREGTAYVTPNNLPAESSSFVGREDVLERCEQLLAESRLVTLLGIGGSGKTRIARRVARDGLERHKDGVWFVDLGLAAEDVSVPDVAAAALGVADERGLSPLEALVRHVGDRRMLIVLDNCEHVLAGARGLVQALNARCPDLRVLATSREPLALEGEAAYPVPALALPAAGANDLAVLEAVESVRLFVDRARAAQPGFALTPSDAADVADICRRLDGIPLALELAAARVRMLGVAQIRARLADRFKLLARSGGAGPSRQQTLLAAIQWSWDQLLPPEQDLMRRLAVFQGGWTLERAAAVVAEGGDEFELLDLLTRLVERSLVVVERVASMPVRYRFLESVHHFALEKFESDPERDRLRDRHLDVYLELAEQAGTAMMGSELERQLAELRPEEENLLAALAFTRQAADGPTRGLRLVTTVYRYWSVQGRYTLGMRILEEVIARDAQNPPNALRASALVRVAGFATTIGDYERARRCLEEALAFFRASDPTGLPMTIAGLGVVAMYQGRFEDAYELSRESLELYQARGQLRGVAMALVNLATIEYVLARPGYGRARFEEARVALNEVGDVTTEALALSGLASSQIRGGDHAAARSTLLECCDRLRRVLAPRECVFMLEAVADLVADGPHARDGARLMGAARAARATSSIGSLPHEVAELDRLDARLRETIGEREYEQAGREGAGLSLAAALEEARRIVETAGSG